MKVFVECVKCGHTVTSSEIHAKKLLGLVTKGTYVCDSCRAPLDFTTAYFCFKNYGEDCNGCKLKFTCFSTVTK